MFQDYLGSRFSFFSLPLEGGGPGWGWHRLWSYDKVATLPPTPSHRREGEF